jgi:hypothetical protein
VVASPVNRAACERVWANHRDDDHRERGSVTGFDVSDAEDRLPNLLNILPTVEEQHGIIRDNRFRFPDGFVLIQPGVPNPKSLSAAAVASDGSK